MKYLVILFLIFIFSCRENIDVSEIDTVEINQELTESTIIPVSGTAISVSTDVEMMSDTSSVRFILVDTQYNEYLLYETYPLLDRYESQATNIAEEISSIPAKEIRVEVIDSRVNFNSYSKGILKSISRDDKIKRINDNLKKRGENWVAGETNISKLSYSKRKQLFGQSNFPDGFEYYVGGVISAKGKPTKVDNPNKGKGKPQPEPDPTPDGTYVDRFDWRNRHGVNWATSIKDQGSCGSCWAFAAAGAVEAITNLYFNQKLDLDLSEQNLLSCSRAGSCSGGFPSTALDYITKTGIVDEIASPYRASDIACSIGTVTDRIKISGRLDFGSSSFAKSEDGLKHMIINYGVISGGLYDWSHAMTLVGYQVVKEGDTFLL